MIERDLAPRLLAAARSFPAVTLTGPRQSGKSTLCQGVFPNHAYASLEAPDTRHFALEDPRAFLAGFPSGAILDEIQRVPDLPSYLQELVDRDPSAGRWILTGSQNLALLESVSQSLAGRTAVLHLLPLNRREVMRFHDYPASIDETLYTGGYPRIYDKNLNPSEWIAAYVATYVERDVRTLLNVGDLATFQRFLELCAGRTAQLLNLSNLADDCGVAQPTVKAWLSVLEATFIVFRLPTFSGSARTRAVKMPKLHFHDTGLVCWLLGIRSPEQLRSHPLRGAIFETWVVSEILKQRTNEGEVGRLYHYRDRRGLEADLIILRGDQLSIVEAKAASTVSEDMLSNLRKVRSALTSGLPVELCLAYAGDSEQRRSDLTVLAWNSIHEHAWV